MLLTDTSLSKKMLLKFTYQDQTHIERVLWIDNEGSQAVLIDIGDKKALPIIRRTSDLYNGIQDTYIVIVSEDPLACHLSEDKIPEKWKERRDKNWNLISSLVTENGTDMFIPSKRGKLVATLCQSKEVRKATIYSCLRQYWQGGQERDALLPRYEQCGGPNKIRQEHGIKRGRHSTLSLEYPEQAGCNVDENMRLKMFDGYKVFYESGKVKTMAEAHRLTLKKSFMIRVKNGDSVEFKLVDKHPTYVQFNYACKTMKDSEEGLRRRMGERKYLLNARPLLGRSSDLSFGPGSYFQIDAWIAKIYLVSLFDRTEIIGMPVVYLLVDVFSHLITGIYVSIEEMSKVSAMMALENTLTDKVAFCQQHGIKIENWEWPCQYKPENIIADRAELAGYFGDALAIYSDIQVSNTAPYRADMKGLVESLFHLLNIGFVQALPGATTKKETRGERDPRLDATLNIYEFTQTLINAILLLNNQRLKKYPLDSDMVIQHVNPTRLELWHWGIDHRSGHLSVEDPKAMCAKLLPKDKATVTRSGVEFKNFYYSDPSIKHWFSQAYGGTWTVDIAYHPRITRQIFLINPRLKECLPLTRVPNPLDELLAIASFEDIDAFNRRRKIDAALVIPKEQEEWASCHEKNKVILDKAAKDRKEQEFTKGSVSKSAKTKNIKDNRQKERVMLRETGAGIPDHQPLPDKISEDADCYVPPVVDFNKWRQLREDNKP